MKQVVSRIISRRFMALLAATALLVSLMGGAALAEDEQVRRLAGADRYETSALVALDAFPGGNENVIIARGDDSGQWADGLAAGYLAGVLEAPILLTRTGELPPVAAEAVGTLEAQNAYILGGEAAVSPAVEGELEDLGLEVKRLSGSQRYETAALIAAVGEHDTDTALVVSGRAPADSMVAGPRASMLGYPILLVRQDSVPEVTAEAIQDLGIENIYVVGGSSVISDAVYGELGGMVDSIERLWGADRFATNIEFLKAPGYEFSDYAIVGGYNLADAVGVSAYPYAKPILYVNSIPDVVQDYLEEVVYWGTSFTIFGGGAAVPAGMEDALQDIIDSRTPEGGSFADPAHLDIDFYDGEDDVLVDQDFVVFLVHANYLEGVSEEDFAVELVEGSGFDDLAVESVTEDEECSHHVHINVGGTLNISEGDWVDHWQEHGEEHPMLLEITSLAPGHDAEEDRSARVHLHPAGHVDMPEQPHFMVNLEEIMINGYHWTPQAEISITIEDGGDTVVEETVLADPAGDFEIRLGPRGVDHQMEAGQVVTVDDGVHTSSHTVEYLSVDAVDAETDTVFGEASVGSTVEVMALDEEWPHPIRRVQAEGEGAVGQWSADFSAAGEGDAEGEELLHDLQPGDYGHALVCDEQGNTTVEYWKVPDTFLGVLPASDVVYGHDWARDASITLMVNGVEEAVAATDGHGHFRVDDLAVSAGDEVTVTDGITTMTHLVTALEVSDVDWDTGLVQGTAEAGSLVTVQLEEPPEGGYGPPVVVAHEEVEAGPGGEWTVDFDQEIVGDQYIFASQFDENRNATQVRVAR